MLGIVVEDVLVDLVGDRERAPLLAQTGDELQLFAREDLAGRVVRRVDDDRGSCSRTRPPVRPASKDQSALTSDGSLSLTKRGVAPDSTASGP